MNFFNMEVQEQAGGWNPIVVFGLHCHNVQKSFSVLNVSKPSHLSPAAISLTSHDQPLNSLVSAFAAVKKGMPPAVLTFFRPGGSGERENSHFSCSCSNSVEPLSKSNASKAFLGLSLPNSGIFGGFDHSEKPPPSFCCCDSCRDSIETESRSPSPSKSFLGFSMQGFPGSGFNSEREATTSLCSCTSSRMELREENKESGLEGGFINISFLVMSIFGHDKQSQRRKPAEDLHRNSVAKFPSLSFSRETSQPFKDNLNPLLQIPVLRFLSQQLKLSNAPNSGMTCERKRSRVMCACGYREEDGGNQEVRSRKAAKRPFLGFSFADFLQSTKPGADFIVENGKRRLRSSLGFARVQGEPEVSEGPVVVPDEQGIEVIDIGNVNAKSKNPSGSQAIQVKLPNMEGLRSSLATLSVKELVDRVAQMGKAAPDYPDKKKLTSVQDFFRYTEAEGRRLFDELDRDSDGSITLDDLEVAMKKRRLPQRYAREFLRRTRKHWFAKSIGWTEFQLLMEQKEPQMLRAFTSLSLSKSGTLQKNQVLSSLRNAGLPATDGNAAAMMKFLNVDTEGSIAYGQFRNFMLLLPPERLGDDPRFGPDSKQCTHFFRSDKFRHDIAHALGKESSATVVPMAPPVDIPAGSVLKSALAGGLASALSTSMLHPLDTVKTRVQASTLSFPEVIAKLPQIGVRGMYRGSIPAVLGQFTSHGIRTGVLEASKLLLKNMAPNVSDLQAQSLSSFTSTVIGTAVRIPCEVLKQRLQAGLYNSVGEAIVGTFQRDGLRGFFRGTGVTLCREVPFYVAGMGIYEEAKKVVQKVLDRELQPWETIAIGGLSGGLAAVATTPFDVMKTRTMTAGPGMPSTMGAIMVAIVREEGLLALFKGAIPRFFWIAPLGAMNFAGYELAKRAMEKKDKEV